MRTGILMIALLLTLAACGGESSESQSGNPTATRAAEQTEIAERQAEASAPTATQTIAPAPPTATGEPTPTPAIEASLAFAEDLFALHTDASDIVEDFLDLARNARTTDPDWLAELATVSDRISAVRDDVRGLDPPEAFRDMFDHYLDGIASLDEGIELAVEGANELDTDKIEEANDLIEAGVDDMAKAIADLPDN